jgi:hypothetical protein
VFHLERSKKTGRSDYQGHFELRGPRIGKKQLLKIFSELGCIISLIFGAERLLDNTKYCIKGRVD